jgi:hypothetical protein
MRQPLDLELMRYAEKLQVKVINGKKCLYDLLRKKWIVLQPEELVRQLFIYYLVEEKGYNKNRISLERGLKVNTLQKRFDVLIYDMSMQPYLLVECKAPQIAVDQKVFEQISIYNSSLKVPYLVVSNGISSYCCAIDHKAESFRFMDHIPEFQ